MIPTLTPSGAAVASKLQIMTMENINNLRTHRRRKSSKRKCQGFEKVC